MDGRLSAGRHFLALWPPDPVREAIARHAADWLRPAAGRFRAVRPGRYHLTLCFLGELDRSGIRKLETSLPSLRTCAGQPFALSLDRTGHFGGETGWLGCRHSPPGLLALHAGLSRVLQRSGMLRAPPRPLVPHVTVARDMRGAWPPPPADGPQVAWEVREWVLVRSLPAHGHAYRIVLRQTLGAS